jgi:hypothetical protein
MDNTAVGSGALSQNVSASFNTAVGFNALLNNSASNNTGVGDQALLNNKGGTENTAIGAGALFKNTSGNNNTADGLEALFSNTSGSNNTADGLLALENNTTGHDNIAIGFEALSNNKGGSLNIALGSSAGINLTTGSNNIDIGNKGLAGEVAKIRIGTVGTQTATFIAGIHGVAVTGQPVVVNTIGQLGVASSSARFKEAIKPMDKASEAILALKPVTFRYNRDLDPDGIPQFGLVAEEVEKVDPNLVARDEGGKVYTVRYEAVNAMLLNEFLKEHRKVEQQNRKIQEQDRNAKKQQKEIEVLKDQLKEQREFIQRVNDKVEMNRPAPQMVLNDPVVTHP